MAEQRLSTVQLFERIREIRPDIRGMGRPQLNAIEREVKTGASLAEAVSGVVPVPPGATADG